MNDNNKKILLQLNKGKSIIIDGQIDDNKNNNKITVPQKCLSVCTHLAWHQTRFVARRAFQSHKFQGKIISVDGLLGATTHSTREHPEAPACVTRGRAGWSLWRDKAFSNKKKSKTNNKN